MDPNLNEYLFVSVRFHRGKRQRDLIDEHTTQLLEIVESVGGDAFPPAALKPPSTNEHEVSEPSPPDANRSSSYTVVEMTTPLVIRRGSYWEPCMPSNDIMGPTLTRCINELIRVINAYRFAEKILIPSPTVERVGPIIISATRTADPDQGGWDSPRYEVVNVFATYRQPLLLGDDSETTMRGMTDYLLFEDIGHPSIAIMQLQAELNTAFYHDGNSRSAVLFAHSASEVFLDTTLMGMLFEEGLTPEEALSPFNKPLKTRLLTEYHKRLGGSWDPEGTHPVATWLKDLLVLRHRVAHAGYLPSQDEAFAARKAYFALSRHLRNRLALRVKRYPITASILVTRAGFERRNLRTKAVDDAINLTSVDVLTRFASWRADVIRMRA